MRPTFIIEEKDALDTARKEAIEGFGGDFLRRMQSLLAYLMPHYIEEGKSYLTIAFGCTGGKHRSVMLAEEIKKALERRKYATKVIHRDIEK